VLVAGHGPFCWGTTPADAAHTAVILEEIAAMALETITGKPKAISISKHLQKSIFFANMAARPITDRRNRDLLPVVPSRFGHVQRENVLLARFFSALAFPMFLK